MNLSEIISFILGDKGIRILSLIISLISLIISFVALNIVQRFDFGGDAKIITNKIEANTSAMEEIIRRNAIGIEYTDPPLLEVNSWNDPLIRNWYDNAKQEDMNCGPLGNIGHLIGSTIIVSNLPKNNAAIEVYITKKDYTEVQPGFYAPPETKNRIPGMEMRSFDVVICDNTPHQIIVIIRDRESKAIIKHKSFTIR